MQALRRCRCTAAPHVAHKEIVPGETVYAAHCEEFCGDDTHWQMSLLKAVELWNAGDVRGAVGGQGAAADDLQNAKTH